MHGGYHLDVMVAFRVSLDPLNISSCEQQVSQCTTCVDNSLRAIRGRAVLQRGGDRHQDYHSCQLC